MAPPGRAGFISSNQPSQNHDGHQASGENFRAGQKVENREFTPTGEESLEFHFGVRHPQIAGALPAGWIEPTGKCKNQRPPPPVFFPLLKSPGLLQNLDVVRQSAVCPDAVEPPPFPTLRARSVHCVGHGVDQSRQGEQGAEPEQGGRRCFLGGPANLACQQ